MKRQKADSSMIASFGYAPKESVLEIEFKSRAVWEYYDVPARVFEGMKSAKSLGRYFLSHIKDEYEEARAR